MLQSRLGRAAYAVRGQQAGRGRADGEGERAERARPAPPPLVRKKLGWDLVEVE